MRARTGDSDVQFPLLLSTANMPELDVNFRYLLGTQEVWHSECEACGALSDLLDPAGVFPARSIAYRDGEYHWACPACEAATADPQRGCYVVCNRAPIRSTGRSCCAHDQPAHDAAQHDGSVGAGAERRPAQELL